MTPKQRFEKLVESEQLGPYGGYFITPKLAMKLLLAEHRRVLALVRGQQGWERDSFCNMVTESDGQWLDRYALLKALAGQKEAR